MGRLVGLNENEILFVEDNIRQKPFKSFVGFNINTGLFRIDFIVTFAYKGTLIRTMKRIPIRTLSSDVVAFM